MTLHGIQTAALKHHGHGGHPLGISQTDSFIHQEAGAVVAGVEGDGMLQLTSEKGWSFEQLISLYQLFDVEVVVVEGFKREDFPKVVLIRCEEELVLLEQLQNIIAVVSAVPIAEVDYPVFSYPFMHDVCVFIKDKLLKVDSYSKRNM